MTSVWYFKVKLTNHTEETLVAQPDDSYLSSGSDYDTNPETSWSPMPTSIPPGQEGNVGQKSGDIQSIIGGTGSYGFSGDTTYKLGTTGSELTLSWDWPKDSDNENPLTSYPPGGYSLTKTSMEGDRHHHTVYVELTKN